MTGPAPQSRALSPSSGVIELHLRDVYRLFDTLDPSPFHARDLNASAEEYIVESAMELPPRTPCTLVIHLDQSSGQEYEKQLVENAIRAHFKRRSHFAGRRLRTLLRRGLYSLLIGVAFLAAVFFLVTRVIGRPAGESDFSLLLREGMIIVGWVAMWRPLDIFLYDWWPIVGERRLFDRLSRISVRIVSRAAESVETIA